MQQAILLKEHEEGDSFRFTQLEAFHIVIAIGFLMGEIQELKTAYISGATNLKRYWQDAFNWLDWCIQVIFLTYCAFATTAMTLEDRGDTERASDNAEWAKKILAGNSIILWVRMLDYLCINPVLGPAVKTLSLMVKDMTTFTVMFAFVIIGFASAFQVWFR